MDRYPRSGAIVQGRSGLQTYMAQVYGWMTVGLLLTAFIAWFAANTPAVMMFVFSSKITFFGLIIAQLGLVFVALRHGAAAERGNGDHPVYALFGANRAHLIQYIPRLYLLIDRQYLRGGRRDVWRDEPLRLYH